MPHLCFPLGMARLWAQLQSRSASCLVTPGKHVTASQLTNTPTCTPPCCQSIACARSLGCCVRSGQRQLKSPQTTPTASARPRNLLTWAAAPAPLASAPASAEAKAWCRVWPTAQRSWTRTTAGWPGYRPATLPCSSVVVLAAFQQLPSNLVQAAVQYNSSVHT